MLIVAQVVAKQRSAREEALQRTAEAERMFELSQTLIGDLTLSQLLMHIADTVQGVFARALDGARAPQRRTGRGGGRRGAPRRRLRGPGPVGRGRGLRHLGPGPDRSLGLVGEPGPRRVSVALVASHRPVGMLVLQDVQLGEQERNLLGTFANQAALAVDRAQLREQALRARLLEEIDRWRSALMGAASHDLRTPLASIKTAVSNLRQVDAQLGPARPGRAPRAH